MGGRTEKLTKRAIDAAKPEASRYIVWDADLKGFGLRVEPSGNKTFLARYRAGGGRSGVLRQTTLGRYGTVTPDQARAAAKKVLGAAATGADPVADRRSSQQAGATVAQVCDWYLEQAEAGRLVGKRGRAIKASTLAMDRSRIEAHVKPLLGRKPLRTLTSHDLEEFQADIALGKTGKERSGRGGATTGGASVAGRTLGMLTTIFAHAMRARLIVANPGKETRKLTANRRQARLSLEQLAALGTAMRESEDENVTGLAAVRLIALTGLRRHEALGIKRAWVLDAGGVLFPDTKADAQARPVGRAAMEVLRAQRDATNGEWLFPADRGDGHFVGVRKVLNRVAARAGLTCTPHVLRHTFASVAGDLGYSKLTIGGLLGHSDTSVTSGYVHLDTVLVAAADRVSKVIAAALDGTAGADIISIGDAEVVRR